MEITLGQYVTELRDQKGWSTRELARRAKMQNETLRKIELGETKDPGIGTLLSIAGALNVSEFKLIAAYRGKNPDAVFETSNQDHEILANIAKQIPNRMILETRDDDEIFQILVSKFGPENMLGLIYEMLRRREERGK